MIILNTFMIHECYPPEIWCGPVSIDTMRRRLGIHAEIVSTIMDTQSLYRQNELGVEVEKENA